MKVVDIKAYEGRNIYSHRPVIKFTIDLGQQAIFSTEMSYIFRERLIVTLPSLREHQCSRGYRGGFLERMEEGTYLGHVIEHVALELQVQAGADVFFGTTRETKQPGVYDVIYEYRSKYGGIEAGQQALKLTRNCLAKTDVNIDISEVVKKIKQESMRDALGPSTEAVLEECKKRNIPIMRLDKSASLFQLGYGSRQQRIQATITGKTSCIGVDTASNKVLTKELLALNGIPVPQGKVMTTGIEAVALLNYFKEPVVVKPVFGNQGKGVSLNLTTKAEVEQAFEFAQQYEREVLVEQYIRGENYRFLVIGEEVCAVAKKISPHVIGDGVHTIEELVREENKQDDRGEGHEKPLTKLVLDKIALAVLARQGYQAIDVPVRGKTVYLRDSANLSTGGTSVDVTNKVNKQFKDSIVEAVRIIGLDIAGVDVVARDIAKPLLPENGTIIEVNAAPGLRMHLLPRQGKKIDVAKAIVDNLFPQRGQERIPVVAVTGTNGKTTTVRLLNHMLKKQFANIGVTCTTGVYVNDKCLFAGDSTGPISSKMVLQHSKVDLALLEIARGGLIRGGLAYDRADVAVVTNVTEDHLGQDGVYTVEGLAHIKSLVPESVAKQGTVVLNADDPLIVEMANRVKCRIIYFSLKENSPIIKRHLATGEAAVFLKNGNIVLAKGYEDLNVIATERIPFALNGKAMFNIANSMAATAAAYAIGASIKEITKSLRNFGTEKTHNPGRLEIKEINGVKIVIDYAHNSQGFKNVLATIKEITVGELIAVIGVPGDRTDELIVKSGAIAAEYITKAIVKEDMELRDRAPGEVAYLLKQGLMEGMTKEKIAVELNEILAVNQALATAKPGDTVVVFYERLAPIIELISKIEAYEVDKKKDLVTATANMYNNQ